ncbi:MAG: metal-dependent hydrolase [Acidobacteria bacterium]|nr:metal-dependent hydrolase [Acidobacteriota bacterium]
MTHTLAGVVMARAGLGRSSRLATTALVVGANLPDIDLLWSLGDEVRYLDYHRGWTHSLFGTLVCSVILWVALLVFSRLAPARGSPGTLHRLRLLGVVAIGVGSHFLMDTTNAYGVRPFLPWDDHWVYGDLWVIIDPWLWLLLGASIFLSGRGGWVRSGLWLLGAVGVAALMLSTLLVPRGAFWGWLLGAGLIMAAWLRGVGAGQASRLSRTALALVILYAVGCSVLGGIARARFARLVEAELPVLLETDRAVLPRPADPLRWDGIVEEPSVVHHRTVGLVAALDPPGSGFASHRRQHADPRVAAVLESCTGQTLLRFFRFPVGVVENDETARPVVVLRDARFSRDRRRTGFGVFSVPVAPDGSPELDGLACPPSDP